MAFAVDSTSFAPGSIPIKALACGGGVPVGTVVTWPVAANPSDAASWLECNGQSTSGYPELAAVVGAKVPDLRGKFLRGVGGNSAGLGVTQGDAMREIDDNGYFDLVTGGCFDFGGAFHCTNGKAWGINSRTGGYSQRINFDLTSDVPTANENRPVNMAVRYLIRARP